MKSSGVMTNDRSDVRAKRQGQRSNVNITEVKTQLSRFQTVSPVLIHIWRWNDAHSLMSLGRSVILSLKVIHQIPRSHGSQNRQFWPKLRGLWSHFEFTNGYKIVHKVWSSIEEEPYCFSRSSVKFQGHTGHKFADFDPNWAFPDCISRLNSPMALKWYTKLGVV